MQEDSYFASMNTPKAVLCILVGFLCGLSSSPVLGLLLPSIALIAILTFANVGGVNREGENRTDFSTLLATKISTKVMVGILLLFILGIYAGFLTRVNSFRLDFLNDDEQSYQLENFRTVENMLFHIQLDSYLKIAGYSKWQRTKLFESDEWLRCLNSSPSMELSATALQHLKSLLQTIEETCVRSPCDLEGNESLYKLNEFVTESKGKSNECISNDVLKRVLDVDLVGEMYQLSKEKIEPKPINHSGLQHVSD